MWRISWLTVIIAVVLRLAFVLGYEQVPPFRGDDAGYDSVGWNLANGKGLVIKDEPLIAFGPVYPVFLGTLYFLFGHSLMAVRAIQAILGTLTVLLVFRISAIAFGGRIASVSALLAAIHPALIIYTGMLLSETLFAFFLILSVWVMAMAIKDSLPSLWFLGGILLGLTILLREETILMVPLFIGSGVWYKGRPSWARHLLIFFVALLLTICPWTVRNYAVFKETIMVSANTGKALWISSVGWKEFRDEEPYTSLVKGLNELERNHALLREGIKNVRRDPAHYFSLCFKRVVPFWLGSHTTYLSGFTGSFQAYYARGALWKVFVKGTLLFINLGLLGFAVLGIWVSFFEKKDQRYLRLLCLQPVVAIAAVHFFLFATSRYQVPILPFILMFSAAGLEKLR